ncbi:MAG: glycosyltransferase [Candidatus Krumholzibacteriota bacterium]|nr:glycosyltransferase [Candidatus Krumholzibacteriota bacterium]
MKVVCFSEIQWRYVRTRKQQLIGRFPEDWKVLFLSSVVAGKPNNFIPRQDGRITHVCVPVFKNFPQRFLRWFFSLPPCRCLWNLVILLWVKVLLLLTGFAGKDRVLFVSNIYYSAILPRLPRKLMLYDCNDDPMEFPLAPSWAEKYFHKLSRDSDVVTAVSPGLVEKLRRLGVENVRYIGNGVDYDLFREALAAGIPAEMKNLRRPLLGYSGAIAPWFDMELLDRIAAAFPQASLVLFGPLFEPRREELDALSEKRGNIFYLGVLPHERLGAYIGALDVCLIPLQMSELMRMADPNKLYEYAAAEKPVVTYRFAPEMDQLADFIYLADTREGFIEQIRMALEKGADRDRLRDFARRSSWQARAEAMVKLIRESLLTPPAAI